MPSIHANADLLENRPLQQIGVHNLQFRRKLYNPTAKKGIFSAEEANHLQWDNIFPTTTRRVQRGTRPAINQKIKNQTIRRVRRYENTNSAAISRQLHELDHEWDIERVLEANAAVLSLLGLGLGLTIDRKWLTLPAVVAAFLLQHAVQGWCPPVPIYRKIGVRTQQEIFNEKIALRILRGDFHPVGNGQEALDLADEQSKHTGLYRSRTPWN